MKTKTQKRDASGLKKAARRAVARPAVFSGRHLEAPIELAGLPRARLERMLEAGVDILECYRVLGKAQSNVVAEVLRGQGTFYEWKHYPKGDVYDQDSHAQYFYHAHPTELREGEHGHFHTFLRAKGMPEGVAPLPYDGTVEWPRGEAALSHLVGISMDPRGFPLRLFTTNRWVTGETWYPAQDVRRMVERFLIDHTYPSWPTNRWISGMLRLFEPDIHTLLDVRDAVLGEWGENHPGEDVFEDHRLEIASFREISVEDRIRELCALLGKPCGPEKEKAAS